MQASIGTKEPTLYMGVVSLNVRRFDFGQKFYLPETPYIHIEDVGY